MPNLTFQAAAEGMPKISRRSILAGAAGVLATSGAGASARLPTLEPGAAALARLIADFREADARHEAAWDRWMEIFERVEVPEVKVIAGHYTIVCEPFERDSPRMRAPIWVRDHVEVDRHCDREANPHVPGAVKAAEAKRARLHAELDQMAGDTERVRQTSGLAAAEAEEARLLDARCDAREAVFRHTPTTFEEYRMRDAFVAELLREGIDADELKVIFSVCAAAG